MQRRVIYGRLSIRLALLTCLALPLLPTSALAQAPTSESGAAQAQGDMPQLLLVVRRDPKASAHDETTRIALQDATLALMRNSGHYQVTLYTPTNSLVKRALTDHAISSIDLSEPLQAEGMRHLAVALGFRTILFLVPTIDKNGLKMEAQLHQNVGQDSWQLAITGDISPNMQYAKRRLNPKETVAVSVDALAALLNLPSHMAADLNLKTAEAALDTKKPVKNAATHKDPPTRAAQNTQTDGTTNPTRTQSLPIATNDNTQLTAPVKPTPTRETHPTVSKTNKPNKNIKSGDDALAALNNLPPQNGAVIQSSGTYQPDVPTAPIVSHPNYETLSDHYHDNHDLANTITLLRYAVNERPRDIPLRRKLILAYQERKMPEIALAEIGRALQIAPNEGSLYRAYGETLMAQGNIPGAEKAYRDAIRLNSDDIQARIALGDALMTDNQYADALDTFQAAQKLDPRSPLPHRRLARVFLLRASADPAQYTASLEEVGKAEIFTPKTDTLSYQEDYGTLMQVMEGRLRELLEEIAANLIAHTKGKQTGPETFRALADIQLRTDAINAYLDKLPPAAGQNAPHVHYQQAATLVLQSVTQFRAYVNKQNDSSIKQQMQDASAEAYQELDTAHKRMVSIRDSLISR